MRDTTITIVDKLKNLFESLYKATQVTLLVSTHLVENEYIVWIVASKMQLMPKIVSLNTYVYHYDI